MRYILGSISILYPYSFTSNIYLKALGGYNMRIYDIGAIPIEERQRFENLLFAQAQRYGLAPEEYLRKVWYHEEASRLGEYVAMILLEQILPLVPTMKSDDEEEHETQEVVA
jgi:hypothetical protein